MPRGTTLRAYYSNCVVIGHFTCRLCHWVGQDVVL